MSARAFGRTAVVFLLGFALLAAGLAPAAAEEPSFRLGKLFGNRFEPATSEISVTDSELRGLGCIVVGSAVTAAAILLSGTAIVVAGGPGAATATTVAVPVLATVMWAGCAFGSSAAPGLAWLSRNGDVLASKIGSVIPTPSAVLSGQ
ncbi:MAG: hypothetical protein GC191_21105 [Azospirillum sp.]|nr:hypothetical protein [Azospirillum sp.]